MALRVRDAAYAFRRAVELGATPVTSPVGPMELSIPAIEGIGGSVVYLVDRYGEFVLYRPRLSPMTYALWFGPLALAALGLGLIVRQVRRRSAKARVAPLPDSEDGSAW